ncbi:MAG: uroporphyrinogen decarboxylase family protein [Spirochaetota bacterium]
MRQADFSNLVKVLKKERPSRATLFEFIMNGPVMEHFTGEKHPDPKDMEAVMKFRIKAFAAVGYDFASVHGSLFGFPKNTNIERKNSISLESQKVISSRADFEKYQWPDPDAFDYSALGKMKKHLPDGMKLFVFSPGGLLENVMGLVGYEGLCFMMVDDPALVQELFDAVGSRFIRYYENVLRYDTVGACMFNDDWGFKTQTMLSTDDMKKFVVPWHKRVVETIHKYNRLAVLHSCGNLKNVMDDIIDTIGYDGKHSYEDAIMPVEEAYDEYKGRIGIMGGIDVDFLCRASKKEIEQRTEKMLARTADKGGYAVGAGNSFTHYIPIENYMAMVDVAMRN